MHVGAVVPENGDAENGPGNRLCRSKGDGHNQIIPRFKTGPGFRVPIEQLNAYNSNFTCALNDGRSPSTVS